MRWQPSAGCFSEDGEGWLWGFGTSNQLGKGDDDEGEHVAGAPVKLTLLARLAWTAVARAGACCQGCICGSSACLASLDIRFVPRLACLGLDCFCVECCR